MSKAFTLDLLQAAGAPALKAHAVPVYEFGGGVVAHVAELSADERDSRIAVVWSKRKEETGQEDNAGLTAFIVAACLCNESRVFLAADADAIKATALQLGKANAAAVNRLDDKARKINGLSDDAPEQAEKNSPPAGDGNGTSPSVPGSPAPASGSNS